MILVAKGLNMPMINEKLKNILWGQAASQWISDWSNQETSADPSAQKTPCQQSAVQPGKWVSGYAHLSLRLTLKLTSYF